MMSFSLIPTIAGTRKVSAAIRKTADNTSLGVSQMKSPKLGTANNVAWEGSFVYFGNYNNEPIKFRALSTNESGYGKASLFLDSYKVLFQKTFDSKDNKVWDTSELRTYLNGTFLNAAFNSIEKEGIVVSTKAGDEDYPSGSFFATYFKKTVGLSGDRIFVLDASDLTNHSYGYAEEGWVKDPPNMPAGWWFYKAGSKNRVKRTSDNESGEGVIYWTRTKVDRTTNVGAVYPSGRLDYTKPSTADTYVAPALNVDLSHIFTSTCISGTPGEYGACYKLTLSGPDATISVPSGSQVSAKQGIVTVPYKIAGKKSRDMTNVSVMILDKEYKVGNTNGAKILFYDQLQGDFSNSKNSSGTFTFPSNLDITKWGTDYKVYIVPEQIKGDKETDYAGVPQLININKYVVTFKNDDGTTLKTITVVHGDIPKYPDADPTKKETNDYVFEFSGWTPAFVETKQNATYTATYKSRPKYTIEFANYDGTILQSGRVVESDTPVYTGETPTRKTDERFIYTFSGWLPEIVKVSQDQTYIAQFSTEDVLYKISFTDENGTVLESYDMKYDETPAFAGELPAKAPDAQYTYTFDHWDPMIENVKADQVYTPVYKTTLNYYTINFVDEDGTVLESGSFGYGQSPYFTGETPTKAADAQYTYTFAGWSPEIAPVTGEATYTATYSNTVNDYTIEFIDEDGTVLQSEVLPYGETPSFKGETPTKAADAQYTYTFSDWDKAIEMVTGNATYTAVYSKVVNNYEVIFADEDGTVLQKETLPYGETPSFKGEDPIKAEDEAYTYTFSGWDKDIEAVSGDVTYTAVYTKTIKKFMVTFVNEDGTVLQSTEFSYGQIPYYTGETPTKAGNAQYSYEFAEWSPKITQVTSEATYKATYKQSVNQYFVNFVNEDGSVLQSEELPYGTLPSYKGETPVKAEDEKYTYTFAGWTPEISEVTKEATYKATFKKTEKPVAKYIVITNINSWKKGCGLDLVITIKRSIDDEKCFDLFKGVLADGAELIRNHHYTAVRGSTVITLSNEYLESLSEGNHTFTVNFADGSVSLDISVDPAEKKADNPQPKTGDVGHLPIVGILMVLSSAAVLVALQRDRKRRKTH